MARGIDYAGTSSTVNRNPETGIRYGIIHNHRLAEFAYDEFTTEYDEYCPHCGEELSQESSETLATECKLECPHCSKEIRDGDQFGDEPSRVTLDDGTYKAFIDSSGDVWVIDSPYYTRAAFCSPCAPGACYLASPCDDGERAYCLGAEWFDGEPPYPVYSVATGERVA